MARTYTNLLIHIIFSTKERSPILTPDIQSQLFPYFSGILKNLETSTLAIGGIEDHVHLLISIPPKHALSDVVKQLKGSSSHWLNQEYFPDSHFDWQKGFGAFAVSESTKSDVIGYILNQEEHHKTRSFAEEYETFLKKNGIDYHPDYWID